MSEFCPLKYRVTEYFYQTSIFRIIFAALFSLYEYRYDVRESNAAKFGLLRFTSGFNANRAARCNFPPLEFVSFDEANAPEFFRNSDIVRGVSEETRKTFRP